jgi:hypothetical protein
VGLGGRRVFNPDAPHLYYWDKRPRGTCAWYLYKQRCQKVLRKAIEERAKRSIRDCVFCKVNLYKVGEC